MRPFASLACSLLIIAACSDGRDGSSSATSQNATTVATNDMADTAPTVTSTVPATITSESLFGNDHPLEFEIGSGKGLFIQNAATARPQHNFLGVEIAKKYAVHAASRLAKGAS